jgi:hypothetical protein
MAKSEGKSIFYHMRTFKYQTIPKAPSCQHLRYIHTLQLGTCAFFWVEEDGLGVILVRLIIFF